MRPADSRMAPAAALADAPCRGRPPCEVRAALREAAERLTHSAPAFTWRDAAALVTLDPRQVRRTICNMARAGELERVGARREPGVCRPMTLYAPAQMRQRVSFALGASLEQALRRWRR